MTIAECAHRSPQAFWLTLFIVGIGVIAVYCRTGAAYINHDVFVMAESAQSVLSGKSLYGTACWDNKPPLTLLAYTLPQMVFPRSYVAIQGFLGGWLVLQAVLFLYFVRSDSMIAGFLGASSLVLLPLMDKEFLWASSEHWHNLFALLVILPSLQLLRTNTRSIGLSVLAGASIVLAMHCRQTGVLLAVVPLVAVASSRIELASKLALCVGGFVGAILALLAILGLCATIGNLNGYYDATFLAPGRYSECSIGALVATAYFYCSTYRGSAVGLLAIAAVFCALRPWNVVLIGMLTLVTGALVVAPTRTHPHYVMQIVPLLAVSLHTALERLNSLSLTAARQLSLAIASFLAINAVFVFTTLPYGRAADHMAELATVSNALTSEAKADDTLFAVGDDSAYLYFATEIDAVHPIFWDLFFGRLSKTIPYPIDKVVDHYLEVPPTLLVMREGVSMIASSELPPRTDTPPCTAAVRLCQRLLQRHQYQQISQLRGWVFYRRTVDNKASIVKTE